jgi:DNA-directed RNA polymerase subunit M/transcription elongation factor TFIIS
MSGIISNINLDEDFNVREEKSLTTILREYVKDLTPTKIKTLLEFRNKDGPILSMDRDIDFIYEIIDLLNEIGYEKTVKFLEFIQNSSNISSKTIFESEIYDKERDVYNFDIMNLREKIKIKGGAKCRNCNGNNTYSYSKQLRAGDEGETYFVICLDCGFKVKD